MTTAYVCTLCNDIIKINRTDTGNRKTIVIVVDVDDLEPEHIIKCEKFPNPESYIETYHKEFYEKICAE